jgi:hypothetical protein
MLTESDMEDFSRYFKPEPNINYTVLVTEWHKFYDTYKGDQKPTIGFKVHVVNGEPYATPKEWNTSALSLLSVVAPKIFEAQDKGYNALQFTFMRRQDNKFVVQKETINIIHFSVHSQPRGSVNHAENPFKSPPTRL